MALVNTLVVDLVAKTVILTSTSSGNSVETITYNNILNQITFSSRADITITGSEFIDFVSQINILQTAILFNFSPNINATVPFGSVNNVENHDSNANTWGLTCIYGATPRVLNYAGLGSNKTVNLLARANSKTIEFTEWIRCLSALNSYRISIRNFFNI